MVSILRGDAWVSEDPSVDVEGGRYMIDNDMTPGVTGNSVARKNCRGDNIS